MVYYCDLPVTNLVMVIQQIMFVKAFAGSGLDLTVFVFSKKYDLCFDSHGLRTTTVLLSSNSTFYQVYHHFRITVKVFFYLINCVWMFTFKSNCIFMLLHNWQGGLFPPHESTNSFLEIFLVRSIFFCTSLELYPLSKRNLCKSLQRLSTELVSQQMQFNLKVWIYGKNVHGLYGKTTFILERVTRATISFIMVWEFLMFY